MCAALPSLSAGGPGAASPRPGHAMGRMTAPTTATRGTANQVSGDSGGRDHFVTYSSPVNFNLKFKRYKYMVTFSL